MATAKLQDFEIFSDRKVKIFCLTYQLQKMSSFERADVMKKPCHRHLTALTLSLPAFSKKHE
jgi:hypothetical protein